MGVELRCPDTAGDCLPIRVRSADINGDGELDIRDYAEMVANYPPAAYTSRVDLNFDGIINLTDLTTFAALWVAGLPSMCQ